MARYEFKDGKLVRTNPFCPRCGEGVAMADRGEWWSCGKCGTRWYKKNFNKYILTMGDPS
jgi:small subunit ribosomal protein S27Ae